MLLLSQIQGGFILFHLITYDTIFVLAHFSLSIALKISSLSVSLFFISRSLLSPSRDSLDLVTDQVTRL